MEKSPINLNLLVVRPIHLDEVQRWRAVMAAEHYLGFGKSAGERVHYVATIDDEWVGLIAWAAASLAVECRDSWIGWDNLAKSKRLSLVVNNTRFLVLKRIPNLASKILSQNLRRLSNDWQAFYGHRIVLAETFVDPSRFIGSCYLAAGWHCIGTTKGFGRTNSDQWYEKHGLQKKMFVRELAKNSRTLLSDPYFDVKNLHGGVFMIDVKRLPMQGNGGLLDTIKTIGDARRKQGKRHTQTSILSIAACAMLSGARSYRGIWQYGQMLTERQLRELRSRSAKPPSLSTFERVLQKIDANEFDEKVNAWLLKVAGGSMKKVAVDGKALRGSRDSGQKHVHLLSALLHDEKITVAQKRVADKSNEITAFEPLLEKLPLEGAVITADAMHCQISHVKFLVEKKKADFIFSVKENQGALLEWVKSICDLSIPIETAKLERKGHGRVEEYKLQAFVPDADQSAEQIRFPYINQVISLTRSSENQTTKKATNETRHFITSLTPEQANSQDLLLTQVGHWSIEAGHYIRDDVMGEDRSRVRKGAGPQVMATLRNLSIGIIRKSGGTSIAEAVRHFSWENKNQAIRAMGAKI